MLPLYLIDKSAELYSLIRESIYPADRIIEKYYKQNKKLGKRDRKFITETIYGMLRNYILLDSLAEKIEDCDRKAAVYIYLAAFTKIQISDLKIHAEYYNKIINEYSRTIKHIETLQSAEKLSFKYSKPEWFIELLLADYEYDFTEKLLAAMNKSAPLTIRVNSIKTDRPSVKAELEKLGYETCNCISSPDALTSPKGANLFNTDLFKNGLFEIQDEGSQLISYLSKYGQPKKIFDGCAGGGGKTLHLSALMKGKGLIYAADINKYRLDNLKIRARRAGLSNIKILHLNSHTDSLLKKYKNFFDCVFIDAPCSGTGVLRRNPDSILKLNYERIKELSELQLDILKSYSRLVKENGIIVYATCSIMKIENEKVISNFLNMENSGKQFKLLDSNEILKKQNIKLEYSNSSFLQLNPYIHNTDGFFAAVLLKK